MGGSDGIYLLHRLKLDGGAPPPALRAAPYFPLNLIPSCWTSTTGFGRHFSPVGVERWTVALHGYQLCNIDMWPWKIWTMRLLLKFVSCVGKDLEKWCNSHAAVGLCVSLAPIDFTSTTGLRSDADGEGCKPPSGWLKPPQPSSVACAGALAGQPSDAPL